MDVSRAAMLKEKLPWPLRPVMTSLNGDGSWLMSIPRPTGDGAPKHFYHVVMEPWLRGGAISVSEWLAYITMVQPGAIDNAQDVEGVARQVEEAAEAVAVQRGSGRSETSATTAANVDTYTGVIDAILLVTDLGDHVHEESLRQFDGRIPVVASPKARRVIEPWAHFQNIHTLSDFTGTDTAWNTPELHVEILPPWLHILRIPASKFLDVMTAIVWTHEADNAKTVHEAILVTPHGIETTEPSLDAFISSEPETQNLALLHGLKEGNSGGMRTAKGGVPGLKLFRKLGNPRYWIRHHDAELGFSGIFLRLVYTHDTSRTMDWVVSQEPDDGTGSEKPRPNYLDVGNGNSSVLF